jgi:heme-degrading monooxygenase HmoA
MPIVSVTRLHLRSVRFFPGFLWYTRRSIWQAKRTPGNLGVRVRKTKGLAFWTLAMWRDNQAIRAFVPASPHREAMQKLPHWCDEAAFADWEQDTADLPSWETAREKLAATGRLVDVLHPSEQHKAGLIETS